MNKMKLQKIQIGQSIYINDLKFKKYQKKKGRRNFIESKD